MKNRSDICPQNSGGPHTAACHLAPSLKAQETASNIKFALSIGRSDNDSLAALIDHCTRCPQLDAVATAAAELLAALPMTGVRRLRNNHNRLAQFQRPALKPAHALQSLADEDVDINPRALATIHKLTANSLTA